MRTRPTQAYCPRCNAHLFRTGAVIEDDGYLECASCGWQLQVAGVQTCSRCDRLLLKNGRCRECDSDDGFDLSGTLKTVALVGLPLVLLGLAVTFFPKIHLPHKKPSAQHMSIQDAEALGRRYKAQQDAQIAAYRQRAALEAQRQAQAQIESQEELQARNTRTQAAQDEFTILENQQSDNTNDGPDLFHISDPNPIKEDMNMYNDLCRQTSDTSDVNLVGSEAARLLQDIISLAEQDQNRLLHTAASYRLTTLQTKHRLIPF